MRRCPILLRDRILRRFWNRVPWRIRHAHDRIRACLDPQRSAFHLEHNPIGLFLHISHRIQRIPLRLNHACTKRKEERNQRPPSKNQSPRIKLLSCHQRNASRSFFVVFASCFFSDSTCFVISANSLFAIAPAFANLCAVLSALPTAVPIFTATFVNPLFFAIGLPHSAST